MAMNTASKAWPRYGAKALRFNAPVGHGIACPCSDAPHEHRSRSKHGEPNGITALRDPTKVFPPVVRSVKLHPRADSLPPGPPRPRHPSNEIASSSPALAFAGTP